MLLLLVVEFEWSTRRHLQLLYSGGDELWNCSQGMALLLLPVPAQAGGHLEAQVLSLGLQKEDTAPTEPPLCRGISSKQLQQGEFPPQIPTSGFIP